MTAAGPMEWLPPAQASQRVATDLWGPLEVRLAEALAGLREATFLICQVPGPETPDGRRGIKYLQYLLAEDAGRPVLQAEASALRFQGVLDPSAGAQQALIDAMGWTRPDHANHHRDFPWPDGLDEVVGDSMRILRDVWGVVHPAQVRIGDPQTMGLASAVLPTDTAAGMLAVLGDWAVSLGATAVTDAGTSDVALVELATVAVGLSPNLADGRLTLTGLIGVLPWQPAAVEALVLALCDQAQVGAVQRQPAREGAWHLSLAVHLPVDGLTATAFGRQLEWLALSTRNVRDLLLAGGWLIDP